MQLVICPGIHAPELTHSWLSGVQLAPSDGQVKTSKILIFPTATSPVYSPLHVWQFLQQAGVGLSDSLLFIGFSAGVVGAIGAARLWQQHGGTVQALIAMDGWGVPLAGEFAIYRISHDWFTHWNFGWNNTDSFYADPAVDHLTLWRSPQTVQGWRVSPAGQTTPDRTTVASYISDLLRRHQAH